MLRIMSDYVGRQIFRSIAEACKINFIRGRRQSRIAFGSRKSSLESRKNDDSNREPPKSHSADEFINNNY